MQLHARAARRRALATKREKLALHFARETKTPQSWPCLPPTQAEPS